MNFMVAKNVFQCFKFAFCEVYSGVNFSVASSWLVVLDFATEIFEYFDIFELDIVNCVQGGRVVFVATFCIQNHSFGFLFGHVQVEFIE